MCFLKHLRSENSVLGQLPSNYSISKAEIEESSRDYSPEENGQSLFPTICVPANKIIFNFGDTYTFQVHHLFNMIQSNNSIIQSIEKNFCLKSVTHFQNLQSLSQLPLFQNQEHPHQNRDHFFFSQHNLHSENMSQIKSFRTKDQQKDGKDQLLQKLFSEFGRQFDQNDFKYKICLESSFSNKLFKNKKFSLKLSLVPCSSRGARVVGNNNILSIFVGIFDKDGNWVHENVMGEPIMRGEVQSYIYQGKGEFSRILINQSSSNMAKQKLNIAIYVAPTAGFNQNNCESFSNGLKNLHGNFVDWRSVKPLILRNIVVLSKKTKNNDEKMEQ